MEQRTRKMKITERAYPLKESQSTPIMLKSTYYFPKAP